MSMRSDILNKIRLQTAKEGKAEILRFKNVAERLASKPRGIVPMLPKPNSAIINKFILEAEKADATVTGCPRSKLSSEIIEFLQNNDLPSSICIGNDPRLKQLKKQLTRTVKIFVGASDGNDLVCVTQGDIGIAESGTLGIMSGPASPTTNNFLPKYHIVILNKKDIVRHYEDLWDKLRIDYGKDTMPRTVNLITGPSRSGDIEQTLILGAHGPTRLHIILL